MIGNRRKAAVLAVSGLVVAGITVISTATPSTADVPFTERWCSQSQKAPCVVSATLNGSVVLHKGDPIKVTMIPVQPDSAGNYTEVIVTGLATTDTISVLVDTGRLKPESTESYASRPDFDRISDGDGTYKMRMTGSPVLLTSGCTDTYPNYCKDTATSQEVTFDVTIKQLKVNREFVGFDRSQSADTVDGIYLNSTRAGDYLESNWDNSRYQTDGTTKVRAEARFRVPYAMLISDFNIPDPSTMVDSSIAGSINGVAASFDLTQDPKGGAVFIDISGVTFPQGNARLSAAGQTAAKHRVIRVKRGTITPTRPVVSKVTRVTGSKARVAFAKAKARGAKVTGYQARCQAAGHKTLTASGYSPAVVVKGLTSGRRYYCSVRAKSKAGFGGWSAKSKV